MTTRYITLMFVSFFFYSSIGLVFTSSAGATSIRTFKVIHKGNTDDVNDITIKVQKKTQNIDTKKTKGEVFDKDGKSLGDLPADPTAKSVRSGTIINFAEGPKIDKGGFMKVEVHTKGGGKMKGVKIIESGTHFTKDDVKVDEEIKIDNPSENIIVSSLGVGTLQLFGDSSILADASHYFLQDVGIYTNLTLAEFEDFESVLLTPPDLVFPLLTLSPGEIFNVGLDLVDENLLALVRYDFLTAPSADIGEAVSAGRFIFGEQQITVPEPVTLLLMAFGLALVRSRKLVATKDSLLIP